MIYTPAALTKLGYTDEDMIGFSYDYLDKLNVYADWYVLNLAEDTSYMVCGKDDVFPEITNYKNKIYGIKIDDLDRYQLVDIIYYM